jgi:hypothetical protein
LGKRRIIEEVNGGDNSISSKDTNLARRAICIHGRVECNLAKYAKYYSYGSIKILKGRKFTRKIDYSRKDFF